MLRSLFLRVGAVYGISNLTNGVDHHGEVGVTYIESQCLSVLAQLRRRMWPPDAEERRQLFELYCDLVSEHHYSPLPDGARDS